jgi:hypothetical protein
MKKLFESIFGKKIGDARVVPLILKIVLIFIVFLLFSNLITNYINLIMNRGEMIKLMNQLLVRELKGIYVDASTQYDIYDYNKDLPASIKYLEDKSLSDFKYNNSIALGIKPNGDIFYQASRTGKMIKFDDIAALDKLQSLNLKENSEGSMIFHFFGSEYLGVYKYHQKWDMFLIRAEDFNEFTAGTWIIFLNIAFWIIGITLILTIIGIIVIRHIFRFLGVITNKIITMQKEQDLKLLTPV